MSINNPRSPIFSRPERPFPSLANHTPLLPAPKTHQKIEETESGTGGTFEQSGWKRALFRAKRAPFMEHCHPAQMFLVGPPRARRVPLSVSSISGAQSTSPRAATRLWCRTLLATVRNIAPHTAPYLRPRRVSAPHSSATIVVQMRSTLQLRRALEARRSRVNRCLGDGALKRALEAHVTPLRGDPGKSVDNLWITWGKPSSYPRRQGSYPQATPPYPQVINRLSTGYPQVNSSHAM